MSQQLASLLLPGNRPEIQPSIREPNTAAPRSDRGSDTFVQTLDRQLDQQQPAPGQLTENAPVAQNEPPAETAIASKETPDIAVDVDSTIGATEDESPPPGAGVAANPALIITPATLEFKAPDLALALNQPNGLKGTAAIPLLNETQPLTGLKPVLVTPATDGFAKELATLNTAAGSKLAFDEARAQLANLSGDGKTANNSDGLLQKALAETSAFQNTGQKGLPNAGQIPATASNTGFVPGAIIGGASAEIPLSGELSITPQNAHGLSTKFGTAIQTNQSAQTPVNLLAVQIARHVDLGINRFQIRMDPPELGRIDVKLEFGRDGRMSANLTVERAETLDLLQRDARALERALANSGLSTDKNSLNFSLKDQSANEYADFKHDGENSPEGLDEDNTNPAAGDNIAAYRNLISRTAVDIRI